MIAYSSNLPVPSSWKSVLGGLMETVRLATSWGFTSVGVIEWMTVAADVVDGIVTVSGSDVPKVGVSPETTYQVMTRTT